MQLQPLGVHRHHERVGVGHGQRILGPSLDPLDAPRARGLGLKVEHGLVCLGHLEEEVDGPADVLVDGLQAVQELLLALRRVGGFAVHLLDVSSTLRVRQQEVLLLGHRVHLAAIFEDVALVDERHLVLVLASDAMSIDELSDRVLCWCAVCVHKTSANHKPTTNSTLPFLQQN